MYNRRETVEKESYLASFEDIEKNDFNLNIPRYVDNFEKEEAIDLDALLKTMQQTEDELERIQGEFVSMMKDLTASDDNTMASLNNFIKMFERKNRDE